ncbi:MAG: polysaccharide biosynthesis tyrosine autokinase [Pyrinomonadaceae bacterium]|nr:polysaccharide biosynthesis tyrosine autokinase [Pyrinomonadaceae bacterium]
MKEPSELIKPEPVVQDLEKTVEPLHHHPHSYRYDAVEPEAEEGIHWRLHDYWGSARKHLWLIAGITLLVTTLAAVYTARQPDIFEAQTKVQVDAENTNPALGAFKSNNIIVNSPYTDPIYFNTQIQILTSAGLLSRVVKTLDLENNQAFLRPQSVQNRSTWESLKRMVGFGSRAQDANKKDAFENVLPLGGNLAPATSRDDLVEVNRLAPFVGMLQGGLAVKQVTDTRLIEIRYRHPDPQVASKIVNAVADAFVLSNLERKTETSATAGDFLQRRIAELQVEIRKGEEQLLNYAKNHQILSLDESQNTVVERLAGLNRQLMDAEKERTEAEAKYRQSLDRNRAEAQATDTTSRQTGETEDKIAELRQKRAQLLVSYTEKYPEVKEIDQQIAVLEKQLKDTNTRATNVVMTNAETRFLEAKAKEDKLRASFNQQRGETLTQNEAAVNYKIYQQEIQTNKALLDGLLQRLKETDVMLAGTPNNIHVVDYAPVPKGAVGPRRMQSIALAVLVSLVFGVALARYLDYLDDSVNSAEDVEKLLRLPALAVIPAIGSLSRRSRLASKTALQKRNGNGASPLLMDLNPRSPLAEAYRQLRTSVLLSSAGGAPKTLLVTSSQPAEGKTTTAVNTALSLVQTGASVLVVDADMRRPRLHDLLDVDNSRGLSTILASKLTEAEMLSMIEQNEKSGLYVLPSGPIPPNPAELTGSEQMRRLVAVLESNFDHVVIDSPPIGSFTDGVLIGTMVDGVLLVVHGGRASKGVVRRSRQVLQEVGAKIFGVVLNNVNLSTKDYYYKYYYNNNYYKTDSDTDELASSAN